jgi:hypothetical protein
MMLGIAQLPYCWSALLVVVGSIELAQFDKTIRISEAIQPGMDEATVLARLGRPLGRWNARQWLPSVFFGPRPRQWIYGTTINLRDVVVPEYPFLNPIPIKFRFIEADETDLVIDWNRTGVVEAVRRP